MFYKKNNFKYGFIKEIILIIIAIAILSYYNFSIKDFLDREVVKNNFNYVWELVLYIWNNYLAGIARHIINFITPVFDAAQRVLKGLINY